MFDHAAQSAVRPGPRHRAGTGPRLPPTVSVGALTGAAVGGGWLLDAANVLPGLAGVVAAGTAAGGVLWWAAARSVLARKDAEGARADLHALENIIAVADVGLRQLRSAARSDVEPSAVRRTGDTRVDALGAVEWALHEAAQTVVAAASRQDRQRNAQAELAEIFRTLAPRLQHLVNSGIVEISAVERDVEDPELMAGLFRVDHYLTLIRRAVESLAVLGGSSPSSDSAPVLVVTAIRRAVAEIPDYARVRVAHGRYTAALAGYAVPSVVHLLAALMENATAYSAEPVHVFVHEVGGGIAIEVLDRGPGMSSPKRDALNRLLAAPEAEDPRARLREGRIGLLVAALLAQRHKIRVRLGPNIVGGTQAVVVIPPELIVSADAQTMSRHEVPGPQPAALSGPVRQDGDVPGPQSPAGLPRRVRPEPSVRSEAPGEAAPEVASGQDGARPPLPRRGEGDNRVPPPVRQAPSGPATGSLMARFRAGRPEGRPVSPPLD